MKHAGVHLFVHFESGVQKHAQHRPVVCQHERIEVIQGPVSGKRCEVLEKPRADPAALIRVRDGEGHLCARRGLQFAGIASHRDDPVTHFARNDDVAGGVGAEEPRDFAVERVTDAEEPLVEAVH